MRRLQCKFSWHRSDIYFLEYFFHARLYHISTFELVVLYTSIYISVKIEFYLSAYVHYHVVGVKFLFFINWSQDFPILFHPKDLCNHKWLGLEVKWGIGATWVKVRDSPNPLSSQNLTGVEYPRSKQGLTVVLWHALSVHHVFEYSKEPDNWSLGSLLLEQTYYRRDERTRTTIHSAHGISTIKCSIPSNKWIQVIYIRQMEISSTLQHRGRLLLMTFTFLNLTRVCHHKLALATVSKYLLTRRPSLHSGSSM